MIIGWIIASMANFLLFSHTNCQLSENNTPPVMWLDRNWILSDTEPIGSIVTRVRAEDTENDVLIYGLERLNNFNGVDYSKLPLPFRIDANNGTIFINDTLKGRGGQSFLLYVTVFDGQLTAKTEVLVNINNSSAIDYDHTRSPFPSQHVSRGHIHPPPLIINNSPNYPRPPPLPNGEKTTKLRPENHINNNNYNQHHHHHHSFTESTTKVPASTNKILTPVESETKIDDTSKSPDITMTLIPVAAIFALILGLSMGVWSVRGKLCGHNAKSKQNAKEQTSVRISNISDEPSLSLKSWRNPKLRMNKYQEWHRETQALDQNKKLSTDKWEFPRHRLKVFSILGEGCFGQVWKCEALDIGDKSGPVVVAVKTLKENSTERERLDLAQELKVMKTLEAHPNVVKLLGCCTEREPIFVILEYVSGGKLQSFLRASREERNRGGPGLTSSDLTGFVYQVAKGMEYLASKGIIHRDLAARNILIDENRVCKVADFGFARDVAANKIYERKSEGRLPIRWMAPESLYDNIFSVKSDIWSFGVLIWEIVTLGSTPYPGMAAADVMKKIKEGYRLDRPEHCKRELYNIMYYCWDKDSSCRPTFSELVAMTEGLLLDEIDYIELDRFPDHSYYNVLSLSGEKL